MSDVPTHPAALPIDFLLADCKVRRGRRSGPGGQHRNKVETAIVIMHEPTGVRAEATERRSQEQNRRMAIFRLRVRLALEHRCSVDADSSPSVLWKSRCHGTRLSVSPTHDDFPAILAEALDVLAANHYNVAVASQWLDCSNSQLIKLLKSEPRAFLQINDHRQAADLPPLR